MRSRSRTSPESLTGNGDLVVTGTPTERGGAGQVVQDGRPNSIWAVITGHVSANRYAFARVDDGDAPGFGELEDAPEAGDGIQLAAFEISGRDDVPDGARVRLWPAGDSESAYYTFALNGSVDPGSGSGSGSGADGGSAPCVEWYSIYLHQQSVSVAEGQTVTPRQQIGEIGPYEGDLPHAHVAIGDGIPLAAPNGFPVAGQSIDISTWPGFPIVGSHSGDPPTGPARFTADQRATIHAHFGTPVDESLPWTVGISSSAHDLWDFYAIDLVLLDDPDAAIGQPVYAAFTGADVRTTVVYCQNLGGNFQWVTILRHQVGDCAPCPPSKVVCEQGYLRRYTCTANGEWVYDGDVGVRCAPPRATPPGSGPGTGPGSGRPPAAGAPLLINLLSRVCVRRGEVVTVAESTTLDGSAAVVHVDAAAGPVTVTLPNPVVLPVPAPVTIKKIDATGNAVTIASAAGQVEFGTSLTLGTQGGWHALYTDGTDWFVGPASAVVGATNETRLMELPGATAGDRVCVTDPVDCCTARPPGAGCCPDGTDPSETIAFVLTAPVGFGGDEVTFSGDLEYTDAGTWQTTEAVAGGGGAPNCELVMTVYCDPATGAWLFDGVVTDASGSSRAFTGQLTAEGEFLFALAALVGEGETMLLVVEHPCYDGAPPTLECVDKPLTCGPCETPQISARYSLRDETDIELDKLALIVDGGCQFLSVVSVGEWKLEYDADDDVWRLTNLDGRTWELESNAWTCCGNNTMAAIGDYPNYTLVPLYDCCPPEPPRYNCVSGSCVEAEGGEYATAEECMAACGTVSVSCCPEISLPATLHAALSGGNGTMTMTYAAVTGTGAAGWEGSIVLLSGATLRLVMGLDCTLRFDGCEGAYRPSISSDETNCSPFSSSYTITFGFSALACMSGFTMGVTITV